MRRLTSRRPVQLWGAAPLILLGSLSGCKQDDRSAPPSKLEAQSPPTRVDSFVPREVALERFRRGGTRVTQLAHSASSRDGLVHAFLTAVQRRDTAAFRRLIVSRDEFAWLYYPTSKQGLPPYSLNPDLMWFLQVEQSNQGLTRALRDLGGEHLVYVGHRCDGNPIREGENTLWDRCLVRWVQPAGDTVETRLFGGILERGGRYKFLSYANKL